MAVNAKEVPTPEGHLGNLTRAQEAKLRAFWGIIYKFLDMYEQEGKGDDASTATSTENKGSRFSLFGGSKHKGDVAHNKHPKLLQAIIELMPKDERNKEAEAEQVVDTLSTWTPEMVRQMVLRVVKHEHPDSLILRFLRARKWDIVKSLLMLVKSMKWRTEQFKVEDDVMTNGEIGAVRNEKTGAGFDSTLGHDFMKQIRWGKSYLHGVDREGRPISVIRARLHRAADQCNESLERYTVYLIETGRLALQAPVETATIVFDLTGFSLANMDFVPVKYLVDCFEANYPESLGAVLINNAPWGFGAIWRIIKKWLDPVVAGKIHFTYGRKSLTEFIAPDQLVKELGGDEQYEYTYTEPTEEENAQMNDTVTRDAILEERRQLVEEFERLTKEWIKNPNGAEGKTIKEQRDQQAGMMTANFWKLDPYVRARSVYDRLGFFKGSAGADWYGTAA